MSPESSMGLFFGWKLVKRKSSTTDSVGSLKEIGAAI